MSPEKRSSRQVTGRSGRSAKGVSGTSLVEVVVAIVVIAIALTGTLLVIHDTARHSADPMLERQAIAIAEAYLEEIVQKAFLDPNDGTVCPTREGARALYDNVCDYDGLDETGARDQTGRAITGLEGYRIQIAVDTGARLGALSGSAQVLRVDATVIDPLGRPLRLSSYRTRS